MMTSDEQIGLYDESLEDRMNIIGQNGNDGTHYEIPLFGGLPSSF